MFQFMLEGSFVLILLATVLNDDYWSFAATTDGVSRELMQQSYK